MQSDNAKHKNMWRLGDVYFAWDLFLSYKRGLFPTQTNQGLSRKTILSAHVC